MYYKDIRGEIRYKRSVIIHHDVNKRRTDFLIHSRAHESVVIENLFKKNKYIYEN